MMRTKRTASWTRRFCRRRSLYSELGGSPLLQQGELDFSPAEKRFISKEWALALDFSRPALERKVELFPATLKRCFPLLKQTASTPVGAEKFAAVWGLVLAALWSMAALAQQPVVLDHVVAVINGSVILESDVNEEMGYAVLQPFSIDSTRNTPKRALQRLIDRDLILQQMRTAQTVTPPTAEEVQQRITQLRAIIPGCAQYRCESEAGWGAFLKAKGLTKNEVEAHWSERMLILSFIQSRFGSGVRVTDREIEDYYKKNLVPRFDGKTLPPLASVSGRIEEILLQQRVSSLLLQWLQSLKSEGSVSILDPAYGQVGTIGSGDDSDSGGGR